MQTTRRLRLAAALGLSVATCAVSAHAAPPGPGVESIPVLEIATDDADDQAKALTQALRSRVKASTQFALSDQSVSLQVLLLALKCPDVPDAACQEKIAGKIKSDKYVWGTMKKGPNKTVVADLHYYVKGRPDQRQQFSYSETITDALDPQMQKQAESMFLRVTQFGRVGVINLTMENPVDGEVFANGQSIGNITKADHEYTLPVGETVFEVRSGGKVIARAQGSVLATAATELKLAEVKEKTDTVGAKVSTDAAPAPWKRPVAIGAMGLGAVALGFAAFRGIQNLTFDDAQFSAYRDAKKIAGSGDGSSGAASSDACEQARAGVLPQGTAAGNPGYVVSQCDKADSRRSQQLIFGIAGGVLAVAGGALFYTTMNKGSTGTASAEQADKPKRVSIDVTPMTTPSFKGVALTGSFLTIPLTYRLGSLVDRPKRSRRRP
jgi:hypothetical protein